MAEFAQKYWYLASPYAKYPDGKEAAFIAVAEQAARLVKSRVSIYSPIVHNHTLAQADYALEHVTDPDFWVNTIYGPMMYGAFGLIVCMLPSWSESVRIQREIAFFELRDRDVLYTLPFKGDDASPALVKTIRSLELAGDRPE